jgi:hypothetical protein
MSITALSNMLLAGSQARIAYAIFKAVRRRSALISSISKLTIGERRVAQ